MAGTVRFMYEILVGYVFTFFKLMVKSLCHYLVDDLVAISFNLFSFLPNKIFPISVCNKSVLYPMHKKECTNFTRISGIYLMSFNKSSSLFSPYKSNL